MKDITTPTTRLPVAEIRAVEAADLPGLAEMIAALAAQHGDSARITPEALARDVLGTAPWLRVLVAEAREGLAGYAALCPRMQLQFGQRGMDLHHLWVAPGSRGRGLGRRLIEASAGLARDLGCSYLSVGAAGPNWPSQAVYAACGFIALPAGGRVFRRALAG